MVEFCQFPDSSGHQPPGVEHHKDILASLKRVLTRYQLPSASSRRPGYVTYLVAHDEIAHGFKLSTMALLPHPSMALLQVAVSMGVEFVLTSFFDVRIHLHGSSSRINQLGPDEAELRFESQRGVAEPIVSACGWKQL